MEIGLAALIESLLDRFDGAVTAEMKLDLLERLSWMLSDNGAELFEVRRQWLSSSRDDLLELALMPWNVAIAQDYASAVRLLAPLSERPELQGRIEERLAELREI